MDISLIATLLKRLGAVCLAFVILWHIANHAGPRRGKAIVHVAQPDTVVTVDHRDYRVESIGQSPIVCDLAPGHHVAQIRHGDALLDEQDFTVEAGKEAVLYLSDHFPKDRETLYAQPARVKEIRTSDLAIDTRRPRPNRAHN